MATANDGFSSTGHTTISSPKPELSRHSMETENVRENGHARGVSPNGSTRQERESVEQCPGSQPRQKAGTVNGKDKSRLEHFAPDRQDNRTRRTRIHNRNVPRHNRSAWATVRRKIEAAVDVLNLVWGGYLIGLILIHFLI